jgi:hypothetical protein
MVNGRFAILRAMLGAVCFIAIGPLAPMTVGASAGDSCLKPGTLKLTGDCPEVAATTEITATADLLTVTVTNRSSVDWLGGPVSAETVAPSDSMAPELESSTLPGRVDDAGFVRRGQAVVARCVFVNSKVEPLPPVTRRAVPFRESMQSSKQQVLWLTGFVGAVPAVSDTMGVLPPVPGVVAVATSRAVGFSVDSADNVTMSGSISNSPQVEDEETQPVITGGTTVDGGIKLRVAVLGWRRDARDWSRGTVLEPKETARQLGPNSPVADHPLKSGGDQQMLRKK